MIAVPNWFPSGCAGPNGCDDPDCVLCTIIADLPEEPPVCGQALEGTATCDLIDGHPTWVRCRSSRPTAKPENATRDGDPKLAAERKRANLAFQKRHRLGPNYVPSHARV